MDRPETGDLVERLARLELASARAERSGRLWKRLCVALATLGVIFAAVGLRREPRVEAAQPGFGFDRGLIKYMKIKNKYINRYLVTHAETTAVRGEQPSVRLMFSGGGDELKLVGEEAKAVLWWLEGISIEINPAEEAAAKE